MAANEIVTLRQIRQAHELGELPVEIIRGLPLYPGHCDYLEGNPELVLASVLASLEKQRPACRPGLRENVRWAVQSRQIITAVAPDTLAWWLASEAHRLRCLRRDFAAGTLSKKQLRRNPRFRHYREYFQPAPDMIETLVYATGLGLRLQASRDAGRN